MLFGLMVMKLPNELVYEIENYIKANDEEIKTNYINKKHAVYITVSTISI
jgi:hypothetical protein